MVSVQSLNPVWNWDCSVSVSDWSGQASIEVMDEDDVLSNDFLGLLKLKLSDLRHKRVSGGWYRLKDKVTSAGTLRDMLALSRRDS